MTIVDLLIKYRLQVKKLRKDFDDLDNKYGSKNIWYKLDKEYTKAQISTLNDIINDLEGLL